MTKNNKMLDGSYNNKLFSILGDSVSTLFGYSQPLGAEFYNAYRKYETGVYEPQDTWWGQVIAELGGRLLVNDSFSGSTVCYTKNNETQSYGCSDKRTSTLGSDDAVPDVVIVWMGCNDRGLGIKLYPSCEAEIGDTSVFSEAYRVMLTKIHNNYPQAEIWCVTLPLADRGGYSPSAAAKRITCDYSRVIADRAAECGCRLIDICVMQPYISCDGLHPNDIGMKMIAQAILAALKETE